MYKKTKTVKMMSWANDLFPINRSITGKGVRETINFIKKKINNNFKIKKISSSTKVFDWTVQMNGN